MTAEDKQAVLDLLAVELSITKRGNGRVTKKEQREERRIIALLGRDDSEFTERLKEHLEIIDETA